MDGSLNNIRSHQTDKRVYNT